MKTITSALRRLVDWLAEQEPSREQALSPRDWSDLPAYHPGSDTTR
jgi:hypothetical protein